MVLLRCKHQANLSRCNPGVHWPCDWAFFEAPDDADIRSSELLVTSPTHIPKGLQEELEVLTHSSIILDTSLNASKVTYIYFSTLSFAFRLSPNNYQESRLMALNAKQTQILEWVIFCVAVSLWIYYNGIAFDDLLVSSYVLWWLLRNEHSTSEIWEDSIKYRR